MITASMFANKNPMLTKKPATKQAPVVNKIGAARSAISSKAARTNTSIAQKVKRGVRNLRGL